MAWQGRGGCSRVPDQAQGVPTSQERSSCRLTHTPPNSWLMTHTHHHTTQMDDVRRPYRALARVVLGESGARRDAALAYQLQLGADLQRTCDAVHALATSLLPRERTVEVRRLCLPPVPAASFHSHSHGRAWGSCPPGCPAQPALAMSRHHQRDHNVTTSQLMWGGSESAVATPTAASPSPIPLPAPCLPSPPPHTPTHTPPPPPPPPPPPCT